MRPIACVCVMDLMKHDMIKEDEELKSKEASAAGCCVTQNLAKIRGGVGGGVFPKSSFKQDSSSSRLILRLGGHILLMQESSEQVRYIPFVCIYSFL